MAYIGNQLSIIAATIENVFNSGVLIGTDDINTVLTANYISDGQKRGLVLGCVVWYFDGTTAFECYVSAVEARPGLGVTLTEISGGATPFNLTITDGTNTVSNVDHILFVGATVSGTTPDGVVTVSGGGAAGIIPESGPTPIKISAFSDSPTPIGPVGRATGIMPSGDDFLNFNFTQFDLLSGRPNTGDSVAGVAGSGYGSGSGGNWSVTGGAATSTGNGGGVNLTGGYAHGTGLGGPVHITAGGSYGAAGGEITMQSGLGYTTGGVTISTPNAITGAPSAPGLVNPISILGGGYYGGAGAVPADGTPIVMRGGQATGTGRAAGSITLTGGGALTNADVSPATAGDINLFGGPVPGSFGTGFYTGVGGGVNIVGGGGGLVSSPSTSRGDGGHLHLYSGYGVGAGHVSGDIILRPGDAASGATLGHFLVRNLPTSAAGLPSGAVWLNSNVMTVVP